MSGIEKIPIRFPATYDPAFWDQFVRDVLARLDSRNAVSADGSIVVSSSGNSVANLSATDAIGAAITAHDLLVTAHDPAFDAHRAETDPHPDLIDDLTAATVVVG
jgi:hypothetical protein